MKEDVQLLGLGSILKAQTAETVGGQLYMIVARGLLPEGEGFMARYRLAPYPFGDSSGQELIMIRGDEVTEVIFEGYKSVADDDFVKNLITQIEASGQKAQPAKSSQATQTVAPQIEKKETPPEEEDIFAKFV